MDGIIGENIRIMGFLNNTFIRIALGTAAFLLIPLALTIRDGNVENVGWNWSAGDFVFAFVLIFGLGSLFELARRRAVGNTAYTFAAGLALIGVFFLVWINGAVGIIGGGDLDIPNALYIGVLAVGLIGAIIARLSPRGMSRTLFAMALAQMLVPTIALIIWPPPVISWSPGVVQVFGLNAVFALLFVGSAVLFRQASVTKNGT